MEPRDDKSEPERTCAGCRRRDARSALLRLVLEQADAPRLLPDVQRRLPGRGISVHPTRACIQRAARGGFARAVRGPLSVEPAELCSQAAAQYRKRMTGLLLAASRSRRIAVGTEAVKRSLTDGTSSLVLFASDAAGRREDLGALAERQGVPCASDGDKAELGRLFGRAELGVLSILDDGIAAEVAVAAARAAELSEAE